MCVHNLFIASRLFGVQSFGSKRPGHISDRPGDKKASRESRLNDRRDTLIRDTLSVHCTDKSIKEALAFCHVKREGEK